MERVRHKYFWTTIIIIPESRHSEPRVWQESSFRLDRAGSRWDCLVRDPDSVVSLVASNVRTLGHTRARVVRPCNDDRRLDES